MIHNLNLPLVKFWVLACILVRFILIRSSNVKLTMGNCHVCFWSFLLFCILCQNVCICIICIGRFVSKWVFPVSCVSFLISSLLLGAGSMGKGSRSRGARDGDWRLERERGVGVADWTWAWAGAFVCWKSSVSVFCVLCCVGVCVGDQMIKWSLSRLFALHVCVKSSIYSPLLPLFVWFYVWRLPCILCIYIIYMGCILYLSLVFGV
jgi:hypothetical protein